MSQKPLGKMEDTSDIITEYDARFLLELKKIAELIGKYHVETTAREEVNTIITSSIMPLRKEKYAFYCGVPEKKNECW